MSLEPITLYLTASAQAVESPATPVENATSRHITASAATRTISGSIVEYGAIGYASTGPTIFEAGSLSFPADLSRVKFLLMHDMERPLGVQSSLQDDGHTPRGEFTVLPGGLGDSSLAEAADGRRDGLSVGCMITDYQYRDSDGVLVVKAATVKEVSLVTVPAFENALVGKASLKGQEMTHTTAHAPAPQSLTASTPAPPEPATQTPAPSPTVPEPQAAVASASAPAHVPAQPATAAAQTPAPQALPVIPGNSAVTLHSVAGSAFDYLRTGAPAAGLTAAMTDVIPSDDAGEGLLRPQWVDELWQASRTERPTFDSVTVKPLTGKRVYGFKRDYTSPGKIVDKYTGNKTEIPTSRKFKTIKVEKDATRWAGGYDIDRIDVDLGDGAMVKMAMEVAADDYKINSEAWLLATVVAKATEVGAVESVPAALAELGARAAGLGSALTKIQFGSTAWAEFVNLKRDEVPWWLQNQGEVNLATTSGTAGNLSFNVNPELDDDAVLAYDRRAVTAYEFPLLTVTALDIPKGGIDLGFFAYGSGIVNDARAVFSTTITHAVDPVE